LEDHVSAPDLDEMAAAGLMLSVSQSFAQKPMSATSRIDRRRQRGAGPGIQEDGVLYRTNEAPAPSSSDRRAPSLSDPGYGRALRYGIGVGRDGFQWQGLVNITARPSGRTGHRRRK